MKFIGFSRTDCKKQALRRALLSICKQPRTPAAEMRKNERRIVTDY